MRSVLRVGVPFASPVAFSVEWLLTEIGPTLAVSQFALKAVLFAELKMDSGSIPGLLWAGFLYQARFEV